jgi:hypothetical protein
MYAAIYVLSGMVNDLMSVLARQPIVRLECIGVESRTSSDMLADFLLHILAPRKVGMPLSALTPAPARMKRRSVGKMASINGKFIEVRRSKTFPGT